jgi:hypothetical protein
MRLRFAVSHPGRKVSRSSFFDFAQNDKREPALSAVEGAGAPGDCGLMSECKSGSFDFAALRSGEDQ